MRFLGGCRTERRAGGRTWLCAVLGLALVGGCAVGPDYRTPPADVPSGWARAEQRPSTRPSTGPSVTTTAPLDVVQWWTRFNDAELDSLVARAVHSNLDLRLATARLRQARAARGVVSAGFWPTVDVSGSYSRSQGGGGSNTGGPQAGRDLFRVGLDAAWELDVFGGVRRNIEAAEADITSAVEDRRDVLVTLAAEVALNYLDLRGFQRQVAIAERNLAAQRRTADLTRQRQQLGGFASALDVANAEAQVATTESRIPDLETLVRQAIYSMSVLLGLEPAALLQELSAEGPIPATPPVVPIGLPSDLLRRRPDIRRADANLHAATARIGVATADLFPRFSLTGSLGFQGDKASSVARWDNRFWSVGPSVSWPLFDAGRIRSNIEVQNAVQEQALLTYRATILTALQDVENALVAYANEQQRRAILTDAVAADRRAVDLAQRLYAAGNIEFLDVLTAQRSLFASEDALVQSDRTVATNLVALYKALGGGWELAE
jgi:outer membrane protein, multidrug efflux system